MMQVNCFKTGNSRNRETAIMKLATRRAVGTSNHGFNPLPIVDEESNQGKGNAPVS
ncbi:MAG: hypothetical protein M2R45_02820 [Verrucomicrobia subdivision 3 bacterium]|nr:hypothetical protein [Limisphaerales bacterium]MCS1415477.1 hypothetical protein [Limisphaerales bacterium]